MRDDARIYGDIGLGEHSDFSDISTLLSTAASRRRRLCLEDIEAIARRPLSGDGTVMARLCLAMLADAPDNELLEAACVKAVATSVQSHDLLTEALTNLPLTPAVSRVLVQAISELLPDNPVVFLSRIAGPKLIRVYDAIDDGEQIRIDISSTDGLAGDVMGCILSIEEPATHFASCKIAKLASGTIMLTADRSSPLFAERRHVLPPSILVVAEE